MKFNADIYVKDVPGQLVSSLEPISQYEGNIIGVFHDREQVISGRILVHIIFDMPTSMIDILKNEWKKRDVTIVKVDEAIEAISIDYMLVGKIGGDCLKDVINEFGKKLQTGPICESYISKNTDKSGAVLFSLTLESVDDVKKADEYFRKKSEKEKFTLIKGLMS